MAIITDQDFLNAKVDIKDIGESTNEKKVISPRYGDDYKSIPLISAEFDQKNEAAQITINEWGNAIEEITLTSLPSLAVTTPSGKTQQGVNDLGGVDYYPSIVRAFPLNGEVRLNNGDIVKSEIQNNTNNPNLNMTGWVKTNKATQIFDENGESVQEVNNDIRSIKYGNFKYDVTQSGVVADKTTDWTTTILNFIRGLPENSTIYIPRGVKWDSNTRVAEVYLALPNNSVLIDDSGYEDRYGTKFWQASQQIWYKTQDYGSSGRANGNSYNIRADYHQATVYEIDAPFGTGGCKASTVWRFNNGTRDSAQFGANGDSETMAHIGIATYGTYADGTTALRVGLQSSIAPHGFIFNSAMIDAVSFLFGKRLRKTNPKHLETVEEWQASSHVTRYVQPNGHTGNFEKLFYHYLTLNWREILDNTGRMRIITKNSKTITTTADAEVFGSKLNVLTPTANTTITESLSGSYYSNVSTGGGLTITLPKAVKGVYFDFSIDVAQNLIITPNALDNFVGKLAGKNKSSNVIYSKLRVVAVSDSVWSFEQFGTWADQA